MNKLDVSNLDPSNPVSGMFLQLLMLARMTGSEKKIVSDLYVRLNSGRNLTGPQTSMLTAIYLKYHDQVPEQPSKKKSSAPAVVSQPQTDSKWSRFLAR